MVLGVFMAYRLGNVQLLVSVTFLCINRFMHQSPGALSGLSGALSGLSGAASGLSGAPSGLSGLAASTSASGRLVGAGVFVGSGVFVGWGVCVDVAVGGAGVGVGSLPPQAETIDATVNIVNNKLIAQIRRRNITQTLS
jgi:hypothetical protein